MTPAMKSERDTEAGVGIRVSLHLRTGHAALYARNNTYAYRTTDR